MKDADVILAIGNSGVGKSTLMNALAFGSDKLKVSLQNNKIVID